MAKLLRDFEEFLGNDTFKIFDDFNHFVTTDVWTSVLSDSGSVAVSDGAGGIAKINPSSDGGNSQADDDQSYISTTTEVFKFATDKPLLFATRVRPYANTIGTIGLIIGLKDSVAADSLQDDSSGPAASYSGALFFKTDSDTVWSCESSIAGTQTTVETEHTVGNNAWDILVIQVLPISSTQSEVHFFSADYQSDGSYSLNEVGLKTSGKQFVAHTITHSSATEMDICLGVKAGTVNNSQYLDVDWVYCAQKR